MDRLSKSSPCRASGIFLILSSSLSLNFFLRCFIFSSYFIMDSFLALAASDLSLFTRFLVFLEFFPKMSSIICLNLYFSLCRSLLTLVSSTILSFMQAFTTCHSRLFSPLPLKSPVAVALYLLSKSIQNCSTSGNPTLSSPNSTIRCILASLSANFTQISLAILKSKPLISECKSLD